jgi:hypothetical protein
MCVIPQTGKAFHFLTGVHPITKLYGVRTATFEARKWGEKFYELTLEFIFH